MAIIQFSNGTKVNFSGNPTQADIEEVANNLGFNQQTQDQPQNEGLIQGLTKNFVRAGRTALRAGQGIASLFQGPEARSRFNQTVNQETEEGKLLNSPGRAIGAGLDIGTTLAGGPITGGVTKTLAKQGFKQALKKSIGLGILSGTLSGAGNAASEGKFQEQGLQDIASGALGGSIGGAVLPPTIKAGQGITSLVSRTIPKRFFSTFFKTTADDLGKEIRTKGIQTLQKEQPELFKELTKRGIVKVVNGKVTVNPTLAEEAIARGFGTGKTGRSLEKMAEYSVIKQLELENKAQQIVGKSVISKNGVAKTTSQLPSNKFWVDLGNKKDSYIQLLKEMRTNFADQGFGSRGFLSSEVSSIDGMLSTLNKVEGNSIPADTALRLRRLIDGLRNSTSFRSNPNLTLKQGSFKEAANFLRSKLSNIPELKEVMNEYSFYIKAADDLINESARRGNQRIFTLFDAVVGGSSIGANSPQGGLGLLAFLRLFQSPQVMLPTAQVLSKTAPVFQTTQNAANSLIVPVSNKLFNR